MPLNIDKKKWDEMIEESVKRFQEEIEIEREEIKRLINSKEFKEIMAKVSVENDFKEVLKDYPDIDLKILKRALYNIDYDMYLAQDDEYHSNRYILIDDKVIFIADYFPIVLDGEYREQILKDMNTMSDIYTISENLKTKIDSDNNLNELEIRLLKKELSKVDMYYYNESDGKKEKNFQIIKNDDFSGYLLDDSEYTAETLRMFLNKI